MVDLWVLANVSVTVVPVLSYGLFTYLSILLQCPAVVHSGDFDRKSPVRRSEYSGFDTARCKDFLKSCVSTCCLV